MVPTRPHAELRSENRSADGSGVSPCERELPASLKRRAPVERLGLCFICSLSW
ncbi:hypothetical protein KCP76_11250 [Salmonella enterica subsp. enterica serovar Weltevreden]|nr:hypothetical protein KCP76_11250 [Salmonella enterica subsp. enterica serovar Weltevreden]